MFIRQVLYADKSCRNAVAGAIVEQINCGEKVSSSNTSLYCKARARLPETTVRALVQEVGAAAVKKGTGSGSRS